MIPLFWWQELPDSSLWRSPSKTLLRAWSERETFVWLITEEILLEYKHVLMRHGVRRSLIGKLINLIREEAEFVTVSTLPGISPDPGDDPFCACAEIGSADFIVTLNAKDFPQKRLSAHVIQPDQNIPTTARRKLAYNRQKQQHL